MSIFFARAKINEALILETFGRPTSATLDWAIVLFPCCSKKKRLQVHRYDIRFHSGKVTTKDKKEISFDFCTKFKVDVRNEGQILRAYKKYLQVSSAENVHTENSDEVLTLRFAVQMVITEVAARQALKMTFEEIQQFSWVFVDIVSMETGNILKDDGIILEDIQLKEICESMTKVVIDGDDTIPMEQDKSLLNVENKDIDLVKTIDDSRHITFDENAVKTVEEDRLGGDVDPPALSSEKQSSEDVNNPQQVTEANKTKGVFKITLSSSGETIKIIEKKHC